MTLSELCVKLDKNTTIIPVDGPNSYQYNWMGRIPQNSGLLKYIGYRTVAEIECIGADEIKVYLDAE